MQKFKICHFKTQWPDTPFPDFHSLGRDELLALQKRLFESFGVDEDRDFLGLVKKIDSEGLILDGVNAEDRNFSLLDLLSTQRIDCEKRVYINWYRFDEVDKMELVSLSRYFDDIWYPSSDDIEIFDDSFSWMLSIRHDGAVSIVTLGTYFGRQIS